ncbi:MAG: radical SAM protein [bacterium]|nr:radical SAM protein [bacterium]
MELIKSKNLRIVKSSKKVFLYSSLYGNLCKTHKDVIAIIDFFNKPNDSQDFKINHEQRGQYKKTIEKFRKYKFLVTPGEDEYCEIRREVKKFIKEAKSGKFITNLRLNTSENCNFACEYCFIGKINRKYHTEMNLKEMSWTIARKAIVNFYKLLTINKLKEANIRFFGGEPLLNPLVVIKSIELASFLSRKYNIKTKYLVNTNGSIANEKLSKVFRKHRVDIIVSLDGLKGINDRYRKLKSGKGTFDLIIRNIAIFQRNQNKIIISTVINNDDSRYQLKKFINFLVNKGIKSVGINYEQCYSREKRRKGMAVFVSRSLIQAKNYAIKEKVNLHGFWELPYLKLIKGSLSYCGGIGRELSVDYKGNVYPCSGIKIRLGTVAEILEIPRKKNYLKIIKRVVGNIKGCKGCEIEAMCSGGCAAEAMYVYRDFYKKAPDCILRKSLTKALILEDKPDILMRQKVNKNI